MPSRWPVLLLLCSASCIRAGQGTDRCDTAADCLHTGRQARCELNGRCSYVDVSCSSGWRYGPYNGGQCVGTVQADACPDQLLADATADLSPYDLALDQPADCGKAGQPCCMGACDSGLGCIDKVCRCLAAVKIDEDFTCALKASGTLFCWGENSYGQLGLGVQGGTHDAPAPVPGLTSVGIDLGAYHACARGFSGGVWCWGRNEDCQVFALPSTTLPSPSSIGLTGVTQLAAGGFHSCVRKVDSSVWCWGRNTDGQIGAGTTSNPLGVTQVKSLAGQATDVAAGGFHSCVVLGGALWCWGRNTDGQVGGSAVSSSVLAPSQILQGVQQVAAGDYHTCALRTDRTIWCWGRNNLGQLGTGSTGSPAPKPAQINIVGSTSFVAVVAGDDHNCAIDAIGTIWCWGRNDHGQIGDGTTASPRTSPTKVTSLTGARGVSLGRDHTCALVAPDQLHCWGSNGYGQLGVATIKGDATTPKPVPLTCP